MLFEQLSIFNSNTAVSVLLSELLAVTSTTVTNHLLHGLLLMQGISQTSHNEQMFADERVVLRRSGGK